MTVDELRPAPDPGHCCEQLEGLPYRLFLDSAATGSRLSRYSFLMADPVALVQSTGTRTEHVAWREGEAVSVPIGAGGSDALDVVRGWLASYRSAPIPGLPPFQGGAAGYLGYEWGGVLERLPVAHLDDVGLPDIVMGLYDWVLAWDHEASRAWLLSTGLPETASPAREARAARRAATVHARLRRGVEEGSVGQGGVRQERAASPSDAGTRMLSHPLEGGWWPSALSLRSSFTHEGYLNAVGRVREYIFAGDIFQANLSQRFEAPLCEAPWALYRRLRVQNAAPFAAFMELPGAAVLSASPERFLSMDTDRHVETRPIKGTRPRGTGPEHDAALGAVLTGSAKDRAENLMIVDLLRNDLSRVCTPGTVRVPELFALEHYATVQHLVSTVVGTLASGYDAIDLLRAAFPGGSITGAPKVRAMEIIAELEHTARGIYCGSIGYMSCTGALDSSIAIRTAVARAGRISFSAGGGIVADSEPEQEYRETLDKARGTIDALAVAP